ncbi:hypothetical protein OG897_04225 [Streptomyces sp. NBC_00237]|uniref:divisome protein SepX/GlpR n=1 Tax=Streptomyces sp. NBC_00237 TaxID=2975687 RepID=UPI00224FCC9E|nr:hypothetical protein [Streptomyces sp. NBC_00237]MCX5200672.1 hypothetical protein [Streptomyces sp. NBC_00237]
MSSSGLIYAVIVGAWAAYLVPMWLRRQDELNEARPTERFSTAIRLLSGRASMERRYAKELQQRDGGAGGSEGTEPSDPDASSDADPVTDSVDVRAFAAPSARSERRAERRVEPPAPQEPVRDQQPPREREREPERERQRPAKLSPAAVERARRSKVLARRRRTTVLLFAAFTLGAIVAAVGGLRHLWAPGIPAVLLSTYIVHLRGQEKRRFAFTMDRRRAELAAQRLREQRTQHVRRPVPSPSSDQPQRHHAHQGHQPHARTEADDRPEPEPAPAVSPQEAGRRALVEQTDHAEWVDQQRERERGAARGESWEPVPVPLPTYVTAPVAPRATGELDLGAPGTWSSARSSTADPSTPAASADDRPAQGARRPQTGRRSRDRGRTPLFDQYDEDDRPRAANE